MTIVEKSGDHQAIVYRDSKDGSLVWDTLPTGPGADNLIAERAVQGLVPVVLGTQAEALRTVNVDQRKRKGRIATLLGNIIK